MRVFGLGLRNLYWPFGNPPAPLKPLWHALDSYNPVMGRALARLLEQLAPELVHTHTLAGFSVAAWDAAAGLGLPLAHTLRDYYLLCPRATMFRAERPCAQRCRDCALYSLPRAARSSRVGAVVGISEAILERRAVPGRARVGDPQRLPARVRSARPGGAGPPHDFRLSRAHLSGEGARVPAQRAFGPARRLALARRRRGRSRVRRALANAL